MMNERQKADLDNRFTYHPPVAGQQDRYESLRTQARDLAYLIADLVPEGREQSLAFTHLETSIFFANAGIARSGK